MTRLHKSIALFLSLYLCGFLTGPLLAQTAPVVQNNGIHCPYCRFVNQETNKFCSACGTRLSVENTQTSAWADSSLNRNRQEASLQASVTPPEEMQAQLLYETGLAFIEQGFYDQAAKHFRRVVKEYPASTYAKESEQLAKACEHLVLAKAANHQKPAKTGGSSAAAFGGAFVGGALGTLGGLLLLMMLLSGGMD